MPPPSVIIPFFVMLGRGAMGARGEFVLLGGFQVSFVHGVLAPTG
jgi:hypothetical protein